MTLNRTQMFDVLDELKQKRKREKGKRRKERKRREKWMRTEMFL